MFLIDKLPHFAPASKQKPRVQHIALNNLGRRFTLNGSVDPETDADGFLGHFCAGEQPRGSATTIGLVIHAAADGIALGASTSSSNAGLSLMIFFAIMVHKAPAAFGLTSVLLKQGFSKRAARAHLLLFSLAAPVGALLTWTFAHSIGHSRKGDPASTAWWTGMLLLFSGGTFLYVAMHSMQELSDISGHGRGQMNGHMNGGIDTRDGPGQDSGQSPKDLLVACFGMILPLILQVGHAH